MNFVSEFLSQVFDEAVLLGALVTLFSLALISLVSVLAARSGQRVSARATRSLGAGR